MNENTGTERTPQRHRICGRSWLWDTQYRDELVAHLRQLLASGESIAVGPICSECPPEVQRYVRIALDRE
jgi:hypothetical protein